MLGIESDPFTTLIDEGLEKLNALVVTGADSNLAWAFHLTQFLMMMMMIKRETKNI